jgi:mono/diheme cytochrome c family protein
MKADARAFAVAGVLGLVAVVVGGRPVTSAGALEIAPGPGRDLVAAHCGVCHSLQIVVETRMSRDEWDAALTWMQKEHHLWSFTDEDRARILDYLEKTQGPLEPSGETEEPGPWAQPWYPPNPL